MKKKVIVLLLILVMVSSFFVGCDLFTKDGYRDYHQVVATINYDTKDSGVISSVLYKGELLSYVQNYGAAYISYYGMTAEEVVEYFYDSLTKQKLIVLYAQEYLYKNDALPSSFKSEFSSLGAWETFKSKNGEVEAYKKFLTIDEYRYCIEQTNKQFEDGWNEYITELEDETGKNESTDGEDETTDEDTTKDEDLLDARTQRTESEEEESSEYEENADVNSEDAMIKYFEELYGIDLGDSVDSAYFFNYVNTIIKNELPTGEDSDEVKDKKKEKYDNMKAALKSLKSTIEEQYTDYDYYLVQQMQSYIVEKYQDQIGEELDAEKVAANADAKIQKNTQVDIKAYIDDSAYKTAIEGGTFAYAAPDKDYLQVKSILLSFSDSQKTGIEQLTSIFAGNETLAKQYRDAVATGFTDGLDKDMLELFAKIGLKVNVSNPDYDAEEDELKNAYTDATIEDAETNPYANPAVDYLTILYAMAEDIQAKVKLATDYATANSMSTLEKYLVKEYASQKAFDDWKYLVNDDTGMFSSEFYVVTPDGQASTYVEEYTVLARALTDAGVGAMAVADYGSDVINSGTAAYAGTTEVLKKANGAFSIYKKNFTSSVGEDAEEISADVYTMVTASGAEISFIVNDYGIHIVMLTAKPMDDNKGAITTQIEKDSEDKDKTMYVKSEDYLYSYEVVIEYAKDEDGNEDKSKIASITVETKTIKEYADETVKGEMSSDVSTLQQLGLFSNKTYTTKVDKIYKQILKVAEELA